MIDVGALRWTFFNVTPASPVKHFPFYDASIGTWTVAWAGARAPAHAQLNEKKVAEAAEPWHPCEGKHIVKGGF